MHLNLSRACLFAALTIIHVKEVAGRIEFRSAEENTKSKAEKNRCLLYMIVSDKVVSFMYTLSHSTAYGGSIYTHMLKD